MSQNRLDLYEFMTKYSFGQFDSNFIISFAHFLEKEGDPINIGSTYLGSPSIYDFRYSLKIY